MPCRVSSRPLWSRLPSRDSGLGLTPFPTRATRVPGCWTTRRGEMATGSNVYVAGSGLLERGYRYAPYLELAERPLSGCPMQGRATWSRTEPLRLPATPRRIGPLAPEARAHCRATKAKSAHTRAASRMAVAGSRIMLGPRRWREAEPDCPASHQRHAGPRPLCERECGRRREPSWSASL
jgi:hypothetical protein